MVRAPLVALALAALACGDSSSTGYGTKGVGDPNASRGERDAGVLEETDAGALESGDAAPALDDADGDGVADAMDCDPSSKTLKKRIAEDDLSSDRALFAAPSGFPAASWSYADAAYRQTRLLDASDVSFFASDTDLGAVQVEVKTASTEVGAIDPRLRQIFVVVGATANGGTLDAVGCGIEVVGGETPEQKTSVIQLGGTTSAPTTKVLQRVTRPAVQIDEELAIEARFEDGTIICDVTQAGATLTTATASGLGARRGSVGFFTRQTKALFKSIRICSLE